MVFGGAATWARWRRKERPGEARPGGGGFPRVGLLPLVPIAGASLGTLGLVFVTHLWIGSVLFGGGYVLVALLEPVAVGRYGWLTSGAFLDGVALTQAIPGPISTLTTFVGYAAAGVPGAFLATAGLYLPSFAAVMLIAPNLQRVRGLAPFKAALEGVSAVVAGAIVGVAAAFSCRRFPTCSRAQCSWLRWCCWPSRGWHRGGSCWGDLRWGWSGARFSCD